METLIRKGYNYMEKPIVSIIMGSKSDLPTLKHAATVLEEFQWTTSNPTT